MKRLISALLLAFVATSAWAWPAKVVGFSDGDTITVLRQGNEQAKIRHYGCKNCGASFSSREAAIAAGYRPCGICKP